MQTLRLIIIDDHTLLRQTWSIVLNADPRFSVVGECGNAEQAIELCGELRPDIVLLDINLPGMNGIEAVPIIRKYAPGTKIIGVSLHTQPIYAKKMMQNGALGYITKNSSRDEMMLALSEVHAGRKYICQEIKTILSESLLGGNAESNGLHSLSLREMEIIEKVKLGLSSKEIASETSLAVKTVEVHRYNILKKLKLKNAAELVNFMNQNSYAI